MEGQLTWGPGGPLGVGNLLADPWCAVCSKTGGNLLCLVQRKGVSDMQTRDMCLPNSQIWGWGGGDGQSSCLFIPGNIACSR